MTGTASSIPRVVFALVLAVAVLAPSGVAVAAGAEAPTEATATPTDEDTEVVAQVDSSIRVLDYGFRDKAEVFVVELENTGERDVDVTLTEAISRKAAGSGRFGVEMVTVDEGETLTVRVDMQTNARNPGVMIVTSESIEQGHGTFLSVKDGISILRGEATWADVRAGTAFGVFIALFVVLIAAWHVVASRQTDVKEVGLDAE